VASARLEAFLPGAGTVDLVDELTAAGDDVRACEVQFRSFGGHSRFGGPVRTLRCREDNVLLRETLDRSRRLSAS
jgi:regulator of ribonuclease activity A